MEKKNYKMPQMAVETFVPNYYIASCPGEEIYTVQGIGHACHAVYDFGQDKLWGTQEAETGNIHWVDPHNSTMYFTKEAADVINGMLAECKVFYNIGSQQDLIDNQGPNMGYGIHIKESVMNSDITPQNPVKASDIGRWGHGGGHGIFVFDIEKTIVKNQS